MNIFSISLTGYKNKLRKRKTQDFLFFKNFDNYTLAVVCDGHSLDRFKYSDVGARLACESVVKILNSYEKIELLIEELRVRIFQDKIKNTWRNFVYDDFYKRNYLAYKLDYTYYGTTISFVAVLDEYIVFFNLGDSRIFISLDKDYKPVFKDNNYIFVNSLAHTNCQLNMQFKVIKNNLKDIKIALFSDGYFNMFDNVDDLKRQIEYVFLNISTDVFKIYNFKVKYEKYLNDLNKNKSFDDISLIFLYQ